MAADPSIYNALLQPPKSALDYANAYAAQDDMRRQRQVNALQMQQMQQSMADDQALRNYLQSGADLASAEGQAGLWKAAPSRAAGVLKSQAELTQANATRDKTVADAQKAQWDTAAKKLDIAGQAFGYVRQNPTPAAANQVLDYLQANGVLSPEHVAQYKQQVAANPAAVGQLADMAFRSTLAAKDQLAQIQTRNLGGTTDTLAIDPVTGKTAVVNRAQNTMAPGEAARLQEERRHNSVTEGQAATAVTYQQDANGNFVAMPTRLAPGKAPIGVPVMGPDGKPIGKGGALNDSQAKAYLFGSRMQEADKILGDLSAKGVDMPSITKSALESLPLVGASLGNLANIAVASPDQQSVEQAQRNFVNAVLRRESGAVISPSEFDSAKKQYFPQVGDSAQVKAQKARNRKMAIRGMMSEVPQSAGGMSVNRSAAGGGVVDFGSLK